MSQQHEEFGEVGFTNDDRRLLYELGVHYENISKAVLTFQAAVELRLQRLEEERARRADLTDVENRIMRELGEKANRTELSGSAIMKLQEDCESLKTRVNWMWAWCAGAVAMAAVTWEIVKALLNK